MAADRGGHPADRCRRIGVGEAATWLLAALLGLVTLFSVGPNSTAQASARELAPPSTTSAHAYDTGASLAQETSRKLSPAAVSSGPGRGTQASAEGAPPRLRGFAVAAEGGSRVFWSGGDAAKAAAADFAEANGAKTLEMTAVGRGLERLPYNKFTAKLWDLASAGFAATARGEANVFIGPSFRGAESVFGRIEAPFLRFKGNPVLQRFEDAW